MSSLRINVRITVPSQRSSSKRCRDIIDTFGLPQQGWEETLVNLDVPETGIIFISGPSGVGKSLMLGEIVKQFEKARTIPKPPAGDIPLCDTFQLDDAGSVIRYLSKFGLGEPRIMIGSFEQLSDGQKERFLIASALSSGTGPLVLDEFTTRLDRQTAKVTALNVGKILRKEDHVAYIASCHDDIVDFLQPDIHVRLSLDGQHNLIEPEDIISQPPLLPRLGIKVGFGTLDDYKKLSHFHYENDDPDDIRKLQPMVDHVVAARSGHDLVGVNLCTRPWPSQFNKLKPFAEINEYILQSFRLIIHPQYRGIGLTKEIDVVPKPQTRAILAASAFTKYYSFPFLAGYEQVDSPFEVIGPEDRDLLDFVIASRGATDEPVQAINECSRLCHSLDPDDRQTLKALTVRAAIEKSLRLACFHRHVAGLITSAEDKKLMRDALSNLYGKVSATTLPILLSETVHMPMAMFVKRLPTITSFGGAKI